GVVWSSNGGLADATGGLGHGVDVTDRKALADALVEAHVRPLDPSVGRAHAETLTWSRITDRYLAAYDRILHASGPPRA
ncbi:MAG: hypothetical protein ABI131_08655, partial [Nostocoides sp.]